MRFGSTSFRVLVVAIAMAALFPGNDHSRALNSHEILVAQTATEMIERGEYSVPYYNGILRLEKPPLPYWLAVLSHRFSGSPEDARVSEIQARAPSLFAGMLLLAAVYALGSIAFGDRRVGWLSALMLATTWHFFVYTRSARPEMLYTLFCTLQMLGFALAIHSAEAGGNSRNGALLGWGAAAVALLSKGPQVPACIFAATAAALATMREPRLGLRTTLRPFWGLAIVATVIPYFAYLATQADGAVGFWAEQMVQSRDVPVWLRPLRFYYPAVLVAGLFPWSLALVPAVRELPRRRHPVAWALALAVVAVVVLMSFAGKLRQHYVLPALPLCAVLAAGALVQLVDRRAGGTIAGVGERRLEFAHVSLVGVGILVALALSVSPHPATHEPRILTALPWCLLAAASLAVAGRLWTKKPALSLMVMAMSFALTWNGVSRAGIDASPRWASAAVFAEQIASEIAEGEPILLESGMEESLVYYGRRRVIRANAADWIREHPRGRLPRFVCEGACVAVDGRELKVQKDVPERAAMRWIQLRRGNAR